MPIVVDRGQFGDVKSGKITATLLLLSQPARPEYIYHLYRRYMRHDEDGKPLGIEVERMLDVVTVTEVLPLLVAADLTTAHAKALGYKTATSVRAAWLLAHPRSPIANYVRFEYSDIRDHSRFLTSTTRMSWEGPGGKEAGAGAGDYTSNPRVAADEAEVVERDWSRFATEASQKDARRRLDTQERLGRETLPQRLARLEAVSEGIAEEIGRAVRSGSARA